MKVILEASQIPIGSLVSKVKGEKQYVLLDTIRIFGPNDEPRVIKAEGGARFLSYKNGDFNVVNSDTELVWVVDANTLYDWMTEAHGGVGA